MREMRHLLVSIAAALPLAACAADPAPGPDAPLSIPAIEDSFHAPIGAACDETTGPHCETPARCVAGTCQLPGSAVCN